MFDSIGCAIVAYSRERDHFGQAVNMIQCDLCKLWDAAPPFGHIEGSGHEGYSMLCPDCDDTLNGPKCPRCGETCSDDNVDAGMCADCATPITGKG